MYQRPDGQSPRTPFYIEMEAIGGQQEFYANTDIEDEMSESPPIDGINFLPQPRSWWVGWVVVGGALNSS